MAERKRRGVRATHTAKSPSGWWDCELARDSGLRTRNSMKEIRITVRCLNSPTAHSKVVRVKARLGRRKAEAAVTDSTPVEISAEQQPFDDWPRTAQPTEVLSKLK